MSAEQTASEHVWGGATFGWYGTLNGAFTEADAFEKFTARDRETFARIAAERVMAILESTCDARYMPGPGQGQVTCELPMGHAGLHRAAPSDPSPLDNNATTVHTPAPAPNSSSEHPTPCPSCGSPTWDGLHRNGYADCVMSEVEGV